MQNNENTRLVGKITMCKRAGMLLHGYDMVASAMESGEVKLLLLTPDLSERSKRAILRIAEQEKVMAATMPLMMDEMWYIVGRRAGIFGVTDAGFAKGLKADLSAEMPKAAPRGGVLFVD